MEDRYRRFRAVLGKASLSEDEVRRTVDWTHVDACARHDVSGSSPILQVSRDRP